MNATFIRFSLLLIMVGGPLLAAPPAFDDHRLTKAEVDQWMKEFSNWGRWGPKDEKGAVNLMTPATRLAAARLIREGVSVSLAHPVMEDKAADNSSPFRDEVTLSALGMNETISVSFHGMAVTHMDSLCHFAYGDKIYDGFHYPLLGPHGAEKCTVIQFRDGIFGRAVLMDLPRLKGVSYLEPGDSIYPADLDAWERRAHVRVGRGDIVLIRTGRWARRALLGPSQGKYAGLYGSCARWLHERDISVLGSDAASDVVPSGIEGISKPIHQIMLAAMGVVILDNLDLEAVAAASAQRERWDFALSVDPLAIPGGTGSPVNPIALF